MKQFQTIIITIATLFMAFVRPSLAAEENYCHDRPAALAWERRVEATPNDLALQRLHALRLGVFEKIERGSLTFKQGMNLFEQEREKVLEKRFEEERAQKEPSVQ